MRTTILIGLAGVLACVGLAMCSTEIGVSPEPGAELPVPTMEFEREPAQPVRTTPRRQRSRAASARNKALPRGVVGRLESVSSGRLRLFGSRAALTFLGDALKGHPVELVDDCGEAFHSPKAPAFDVGIVVTPVGRGLQPRGFDWAPLGSFTPVVLDGGGHEPLVVPRRWLPMVERCMVDGSWRAHGVRPRRDLTTVVEGLARHPAGRVLVSSVTRVRGTSFVRTEGRGVRFHLVFRRRTAAVEALLDHLLRGDGHQALRESLATS